MSEIKTITQNGVTVAITSNKEEVIAALRNAISRGLAVIGEKAVDHAQDKVPVNTGNLKNSITYSVEDDGVYIGTNVFYAPYVELGTGVLAEGGDGRKTPWSYQDEKGRWHHTNGARPQPFLRPAATEHAEEYLDILKQSLENA